MRWAIFAVRQHAVPGRRLSLFSTLDKRRTKSEYRCVLFTLDRPAKLVGIARLATESHRLAAKSKVEYFELPARSILNRCSNARMPFRWTINPYRGCEFGCKYCYARYTHEFMGMEVRHASQHSHSELV